MTEHRKALVGGILGALVGGLAGYLFLTEHGRSIRLRLEPTLDDVARDLSSVRQTLEKAAQVAHEVWGVLRESSQS